MFEKASSVFFLIYIASWASHIHFFLPSINKAKTKTNIVIVHEKTAELQKENKSSSNPSNRRIRHPSPFFGTSSRPVWIFLRNGNRAIKRVQHPTVQHFWVPWWCLTNACWMGRPMEKSGGEKRWKEKSTKLENGRLRLLTKNIMIELFDLGWIDLLWECNWVYLKICWRFQGKQLKLSLKTWSKCSFYTMKAAWGLCKS